MISATAASSASLARAVIAFRQPYAQAAARSAQAAGWTTGRQAAGWQAVSPATATLRPAGQRRLFSDTPFVVQSWPGSVCGFILKKMKKMKKNRSHNILEHVSLAPCGGSVSEQRGAGRLLKQNIEFGVSLFVVNSTA